MIMSIRIIVTILTILNCIIYNCFINYIILLPLPAPTAPIDTSTTTTITSPNKQLLMLLFLLLIKTFSVNGPVKQICNRVVIMMLVLNIIINKYGKI